MNYDSWITTDTAYESAEQRELALESYIDGYMEGTPTEAEYNDFCADSDDVPALLMALATAVGEVQRKAAQEKLNAAFYDWRKQQAEIEFDQLFAA